MIADAIVCGSKMQITNLDIYFFVNFQLTNELCELCPDFLDYWVLIREIFNLRMREMQHCFTRAFTTLAAILFY